MTAGLPVPPRSAQNSSGWCSASTRSCSPVAGDDVEGQDRVAAQAEGARQPADAAAERVADEPDVGRGARQRGEAELGGGRRQVGAQRTGLDAGAAALEVDLDAAHQARVEQDRLVDAGAGRALWPVPCGATRRPSWRAKRTTAAMSSAVRGSATKTRALVGHQVPRHAGVVVAGVAGSMEVAGELRAEGVQRDGGTSGGDQGESFGETGWGADADPGLPRRPSHQGYPLVCAGVRTTAPSGELT